MNDWVFYLWIGIISLIAILLILFGIFPLAALLPSLRAMCFGRYMNRYFIVQRRKNGSYTLHHNPMLFYYSCSERKFYRLLMDAILKFKKGYPDQVLVAQTFTFQSSKREGKIIPYKGIHLWGYRVLGGILILRNVYNFRKNKNGMRRYKPLLHDLFISQVIEYVVVDDQVKGDMLDERRTN